MIGVDLLPSAVLHHLCGSIFFRKRSGVPDGKRRSVRRVGEDGGQPHDLQKNGTKQAKKRNFVYFCAFVPNKNPRNETLHVQAQTRRHAPQLLACRLYARPDGRRHRRHRRPAAGHRLRHRFGRLAREGHHHGRHRRLCRLAAGRQPRPDWRPDRRLHHHRLRHRPGVRRGGTSGGNAHGRRAAPAHGALPAGYGHQVHPLSHHRGLHERYCRDHLHHAGGRHLRPRLRRREGAGRLHREVGPLLPPLRHGQLVEYARRRAEHRHHRPHAEAHAPHPRLARGHRRDDGSRLGAAPLCGHRLHRHHRRPLHDSLRAARRGAPGPRLGGRAEPLPGSGDHRAAGGHRVAPLGHGATASSRTATTRTPSSSPRVRPTC